MIHPNTEVRYISDNIGFGLFATHRIPMGTITWTLDHLDRIFTQKEMDAHDGRYQEILMKYSFRNKKGEYVFCWDNGKFINHSFNSNCCLTPYNFEIAIRDIEKDEELTDDYGYLNIIEPFEALPEGGERKIVYPDDLLRYADRWDKKLRAAFPLIDNVSQPLYRYIESDIRNQLTDIRNEQRELLSIMECYYPGG